MRCKKFFALIVFSLTLIISVIPAFSAENFAEKATVKSPKIPPELRVWTHESVFKAKDGDQEIILRATYYSNEYVEALVNSEAEKNLWTQDEMENYKYTLLKNLNLAETIPIHLSITVMGIPIYAQPFDKHIHMIVGKNKYEPVDFERRFNFKIIGDREGMVHFPRYDPKTGKEILQGARDLRISLDSSISHAIASRGRNVLWIWDLSKDRGGVLKSGKAASRLEIDRLLKRMDKLRTDRDGLQRQLDALNKEYNEVSSRIDELQTRE